MDTETISETPVLPAPAPKAKTLWMRFLIAYHDEALKLNKNASYAVSMRAAKVLYGTRDPADPKKINVKIAKDASDEQLREIAKKAMGVL